MKHRWRKFRAGWRDTLILIREFQAPLLFFTITVLGGGFAYFVIAESVGEPVKSIGEAIYTILSSAFLQALGDFPKNITLQLFHFLMPLIAGSPGMPGARTAGTARRRAGPGAGGRQGRLRTAMAIIK